MAERLIVIGADAAGMSAASQARRRRPDLDIVAFEKGNWTSYSACGIPYVVGGEVDSLEDLVARTPQELRNKQRIDVRLRHEVVSIDPVAARVTVRDHVHHRELQLGYDQLLIASGARPTRPDLPGIDGESVHGVQTLDDAANLLGQARQSRSSRVVVVGGGYIGLEMAEAFLRWGADVHLVEGSDQLMSTFDPDMAAPIRAAVERHGVVVRTGVQVQAFEPGRVLTSDGPLEADLVVLGIGVTPNTEMASAAGIELGHRGAIKVDRRQRTSRQGVWAAGDCALSFHRVSERWQHIALGTVANRQGRVAGINLASGYATFPGVVGTAVSKICATEVGRTGLNETEATTAGFEHVSTVVESTTRAGYFPGSRPITVKLVAERGSGRVLGGQIVGEEGAANRVDVLAAVITAGMDLEALVDLDLGYAPPFSPLWDPVVVAARVLLKQV
ncbi:MAG: flavoprotein oxidoreductase [Acidimicrobiia bacterium]|nr:flavoprotein oxidoreductase [Acidimicrobiia bacterium]